MQNERRMRAALSDSRSMEVGQKASLPSLFESLFTGAPSRSSFFQAQSKVLFEVVLVLDQRDSVLMVAAEEGAGEGSELVSKAEWEGCGEVIIEVSDVVSTRPEEGEVSVESITQRLKSCA